MRIYSILLYNLCWRMCILNEININRPSIAYDNRCAGKTVKIKSKQTEILSIYLINDWKRTSVLTRSMSKCIIVQKNNVKKNTFLIRSSKNIIGISLLINKWNSGSVAFYFQLSDHNVEHRNNDWDNPLVASYISHG